MQRGVLAQQFRPDARVLDLVGGDARPLIGGDVAHAIAAGLHGVQPDAGEVGERVGKIGELDPIELEILARGEMPVAAIIAPAHMGEHAQLLRRQGTVGNGDPQHIGVKLQIDAVHETQRLEFLLRQLARHAPRHLVAEFPNPFGEQRLVEFVVKIHLTAP